MCGIAGVLGGWSGTDATEIASTMISALAHRGPDGRRVRVLATGQDTHLALAHARLSVLDLTPAAGQPMRHEETGSCLIYNGELYNYRALRADLERKGHRFRSTGDTEVLLGALVEWGADALPRLSGMYAFAYWDAPGRRLLLARDPLGIKPLVLAHTRRGLVFASEVRALRVSGVVDVRVSPGAVRSFLTYGAVIEPETALTAVVALPPGSVVMATPDGKVEAPANVWGLEKLLEISRGPAPADDRDPSERVGRALAGAVESHLIADVRVGVLLSGGVDSTLLAATADRVPDRALELLTVAFDGAESSEVTFARAVAPRLRSPHTVVTLSGRELSDMLPAALAAMDQPTVDGINVFAVSSIAATRGIRVLLSGLGGDELFGGYTTFRNVPLVARFGRYAAALAPIAAALARDRVRQQQWQRLSRAERISECRDAYLLQRAIYCGPSHPAMPALEGPPDDCQMPPETWERLATAADWDPFHQVSYLEQSFYMRNQLLRDADIFSSAVAVEMRVPYLDVDVVRAAWHATAGDHSSGGRGKAMLRALLARAVPDVTPRGRKIGFTFPWNDWLRGPLKPMVEDILHTPAAYQTLGLDARSGCRMFDDFLNARGTVSWFNVWSLFVLLTWHAEQRQSLAA